MKLNQEYNVQEIMGSFVAVPKNSEKANYSDMIRMNETGAFIFAQLKYETTEDQIVQMLCNRYDADEDLLRKDAHAFIQMLEERGLFR